MSGRTIVAQALTREAFAPFGAVIDTAGTAPRPMNAGKARRFHDLADGLLQEPALHAIEDFLKLLLRDFTARQRRFQVFTDSVQAPDKVRLDEPATWRRHQGLGLAG